MCQSLTLSPRTQAMASHFSSPGRREESKTGLYWHHSSIIKSPSVKRSCVRTVIKASVDFYQLALDEITVMFVHRQTPLSLLLFCRLSSPCISRGLYYERRGNMYVLGFLFRSKKHRLWFVGFFHKVLRVPGSWFQLYRRSLHLQF